jgi:RHS repeat-associated protein
MKSVRLFVLFAIIAFGSAWGFSQAANEQGIKPYGSYHGTDLDEVNVSNGHLELRIPVVSFPQRGGHLKLSFIARWHNAVWNEHTDCAQSTNICFHIWEFDNQPGVSFVTEQAFPSIPQTLVSGGNTPSPVYAYSIRLGDESSHPLGNTSGTVYESLDATAMRWDSSSQTVTLSDGSRYAGIFGSTPVLEDTNGNQITFNGGSLVDTLGRSIPSAGSGSTQDFSGCTGPQPISSASLWISPGANGSLDTFKLCYVQVHVYTHHWTLQSTSTQKYIEPNGNYSLLQSIVLPDQTAWTFEYSQPDANGVNWGDLVKVTLPAGGTISYTWAHTQGCHHLFGPPGSWSGHVLQRSIDAQDGTGPHPWTYGAGSSAGQTKVTDPLLNDTVHTFTELTTNSCAFYETKTDFYRGSQSSGALLKTISTDYSFTAMTSPWPPINVVPIRKTLSWPNGQVRKTEFSYDSGFAFNSGGSTGIYGKETSRREYDYGTNAPGALLKSTVTSYWWQNPANSLYLTYNIVDLPNVVTVQDASGNRVSQSTISYDETPAGTSGISTSHDANPPNGNIRGNPTTTSVWLSGSTVSTTSCPVSVSNGSLTATNTYLDTGLVSQSNDACGHQTSLQYSALYAGAYPTQSCNALNQCTTMDYDLNTGLITGLTDPNGQITGKKTTYAYDNIGRLIGITYPDGGQANAFYSNATTVEVKKLQDSTANVWIDSYTYLDGLRRPKQTRLVDPEGDVYSETTYDAMGRVATVSNPHRSVTSPTDGITTKQYDTFGRPSSVTHPDGNVLQTVYSDPAVVTLIDETGRPRRETHDALERLIKVEEPSGGTAGSKATASVTINGTLQSKVIGGQPAVQASARILISGEPANCDVGYVYLTVGSYAEPGITYACGTTAQQMAQGLASNFGSTQVTATTQAGSDVDHWYIVLTANQGGSSGNSIAFNLTYSTFYPGQYPAPYSFSPASGNLSGGQDAVAGTTVYDAGTLTMSLDGYSATANYGNGTGLDATAAAVASDLVSRINAQLPTSNPPFTISVPAGGAAISVVWGSVGSAGNINTVNISSTTTQATNFSLPSFAGCQPISTSPQNCSVNLSGGTDPYSLDSPASWPTLYSYDLLNNLLRVEQHGNTTDSTQWRVRTFQYDSLSHLIQSNNPEAGQLNFTYDAAGNMLSRTDARGIVVTRTYDVLSRLIQESYSDGTPSVSFSYDQTSAWGVSLANAVGRISSTSAAGGTVGSVVSYDPLGRPRNEWVCLPSNCGTGSYAISALYDLAGHVKSLTYPSGRTVTTGYNSAGRTLSSILTNFAGQATNFSYYTVPQAGTAATWGYNPNGSLRTGTFGNSVSETYGFNNRLQLNAIIASSSSQTWLSKIYGLYDVNNHNNGIIWSIVDGISSSRNQSYQYDPVGRVTSGLQQDGAFNQTFNYDPWGNMTTSGTNNFNPLYDGKNRISGAPANCTSANAYCYDADGNLLNDGFHQYVYDGYNRIKSVDSAGATYTYDATGARVRKTTGGKSTEYVNFQGVPIAEKDLSTGYWSDYVFFNGDRIARANNFERQLHITGQICANCGWQWYQFNFTNLGSIANRVIQSGDTFRWVQWSNAGSKGGLVITFTDGTESWMSGQDLVDQNGEEILRGNLSTNQWEYRISNLSPVVGKTISQVRLYADGSSQPGQWDIYFQDLVYVSADGTVIPLFSQNATVPALSGFGSTGMSSTSASIHDCSLPACSPAPINSTMYFHADQIGSARLLTAGYGYPVWQGTFTPFGQEVSPQLTTNHYKFNGKERGEATEGGLDYFGARYYSSVLGRWMTPDWSEAPSAVPYAKLADPQSLNLYSYVSDDPLSHTDVDGHFQTHAATTASSCPQAPNGGNGDACAVDDRAKEIADAAQQQDGSMHWAVNDWNISNGQLFRTGSDKCNEFVSDEIADAGGQQNRPTVADTGKIPTASQYADPKVKITGLSEPRPLSEAKPGDVIAQYHGTGVNGNAEGHAGIVVAAPTANSPGQTASANANQGGKVTVNDWGFRKPNANPNNGERNGASSPPPVVRHPLAPLPGPVYTMPL